MFTGPSSFVKQTSRLIMSKRCLKISYRNAENDVAVPLYQRNAHKSTVSSSGTAGKLAASSKFASKPRPKRQSLQDMRDEDRENLNEKERLLNKAADAERNKLVNAKQKAIGTALLDDYAGRFSSPEQADNFTDDGQFESTSVPRFGDRFLAARKRQTSSGSSFPDIEERAGPLFSERFSKRETNHDKPDRFSSTGDSKQTDYEHEQLEPKEPVEPIDTDAWKEKLGLPADVTLEQLRNALSLRMFDRDESSLKNTDVWSHFMQRSALSMEQELNIINPGFTLTDEQIEGLSREPLEQLAIEEGYADEDADVVSSTPSQNFLDSLNEADRNLFESVNAQWQIWRCIHPDVVSSMTDISWRRLLDERPTTQSQRLSFFRFLRKKELAKMMTLRRARAVDVNYLLNVREQIIGFRRGEITYSLYHNSIMERVNDNRIRSFYSGRIANGIQCGSTLTVCYDMRWYFAAPPRSQNLMRKQMAISLRTVREHRVPVDLHLVNCPPARDGSDSMAHAYDTMHTQTVSAPQPAGVLMPEATCSSYVDLWPRERIVYLSPDAKEMLDDVDEDTVYIIGAIVDIGIHGTGFTTARATIGAALGDNVVARRLPIDKYLIWGLGTKQLLAPSCIRILQDYVLTRDWKYALTNNVNKRKLVDPTAPLHSTMVARKRRRRSFEHSREALLQTGDENVHR